MIIFACLFLFKTSSIICGCLDIAQTIVADVYITLIMQHSGAKIEKTIQEKGLLSMNMMMPTA